MRAPRIPTNLTLLVAAATSAMTYGAVFALLADLQDEHGLPTWGLGLITASAFGASVAAQLGLARFADRGHARRMIALGLGLTTLGTLGFAAGSTLWQFVAARLLLGFGGGMTMPAVRRVVIMGDPGRAGERIGGLSSVEIAGFVTGPPTAAFVADHFGLHTPFLLQAALLALCIPGIARLAEPPVEADAHRRGTLSLLRSRTVRAGTALTAGVYLGVGVFDAIWARFLKDLGASTTFVGVTLTLWALPMVFLMPLGGRLADRDGAVRTGVVTLSFAAVCIAAYGISPTLLSVCLLGLLHALSEAITTPAGAAAVAQGSGAQMMAAGQGLQAAVGNVAAAVAALFAGGIYGAAGAGTLWFLTAGAVAVFAALAFAWSRERVPAGAIDGLRVQPTATGTLE